MNVNLMQERDNMHNDIDLIFGHETLVADLELQPMLDAMAQGDETIYSACYSALMQPLMSIDEITYRQNNLQDAINNPEAVRGLYDIAVTTMQNKRKIWFWASTSQYISTIFSSAVEALQMYAGMLMKLRKAADASIQNFSSRGFSNFLSMLQRELNDDYINEINRHLAELKDKRGMLISAKLGSHLQGINYTLRRKIAKGFLRKWSFAPSYSIAPRDYAGAKDVTNRKEQAITHAANALAQSVEHLESFFVTLQYELAFYMGCINLNGKMRELGMSTVMPNILPKGSTKRGWRGLYDISLALILNSAVVGNDLDVEDRSLFLITGANQGGKSTFLRSIGQAQLMAQCGMFVGADSLTLPIRRGIFSHFKKEEDNSLKHGKLDEELARMDGIVNHLEPGCLLLFNESFSSTNEMEGSEICRQITKALVESGVEVFSVTHLYSYAMNISDDGNAVFLRAQRLPNNERTYKIVPGMPERTAYGMDLYTRVFINANCVL